MFHNVRKRYVKLIQEQFSLELHIPFECMVSTLLCRIRRFAAFIADELNYMLCSMHAVTLFEKCLTSIKGTPGLWNNREQDIL